MFHHRVRYAAERKRPRSRAAWAVKNHREQSELVEKGSSHGILVYEDGDPVGWCQYGSREELPRIDHARNYRGVPPSGGGGRLWRITCFGVDKEHRKRGVASAGLRAALEAIRSKGGGVVEAYPVIVTDQGSNYLYPGTASMFERVGFKVVAPLGTGRTATVVMRKTVPPRSGVGGR
jgi:ribosomal protein S18 acetylase RimI-like enzyme